MHRGKKLRGTRLFSLMLLMVFLLVACGRSAGAASGANAQEISETQETLESQEAFGEQDASESQEAGEQDAPETQAPLAGQDALGAPGPGLNVALFPYVPNVERFQKGIEDAWKKIHPEVPLSFQTWDCYEETEIDDSLDVVTFDAIFLTEYARNNELLAIDPGDINDRDGILPFVRDGLVLDGKEYGIPQMICANLFFYRDGDEEVAKASNIGKLYEALGDNNSAEVRPENGKGLLVDMSSGTGNTCLYLDAIIDTRAVYTDFTVMPDLEKINEQAIEGLNRLILMAGREQAYYYDENDDYIRAKWFGEGSGRAYIGYSESMANMGDISKVKIKTMSLADREDIPLFYVDMVAANSSLTDNPEKKDLALELINLMTDREVMTEIIGGGETETPQYILPARSACYTDLEEKSSIYTQLKSITGKEGNHVFRMGGDAHEYIKTAKKVLPNYLLQK